MMTWEGYELDYKVIDATELAEALDSGWSSHPYDAYKPEEVKPEAPRRGRPPKNDKSGTD
jgi:hypothetical protein